jgi:hypothetical protein
MITLGSGGALAQTGADTLANAMDIYGGHSKAASSCPGLGWTVAAARPNMHGYFYWDDGSGASKATGAANPDGSFQLSLTSLDGNGPVGTVTGKRAPNGALSATLKGQGCANIALGTQTMPEYRAVGSH